MQNNILIPTEHGDAGFALDIFQGLKCCIPMEGEKHNLIFDGFNVVTTDINSVYTNINNIVKTQEKANKPTNRLNKHLSVVLTSDINIKKSIEFKVAFNGDVLFWANKSEHLILEKYYETEVYKRLTRDITIEGFATVKILFKGKEIKVATSGQISGKGLDNSMFSWNKSYKISEFYRTFEYLNDFIFKDAIFMCINDTMEGYCEYSYQGHSFYNNEYLNVTASEYVVDSIKDSIKDKKYRALSRENSIRDLKGREKIAQSLEMLSFATMSVASATSSIGGAINNSTRATTKHRANGGGR